MNEDPRDMDTTNIVESALTAGRRSAGRLRILTAVFGIVALAATAFGITGIVQARDAAQSQTRSTGDSATDLANQVLAACKGEDRQAKALRDANLCGQAAQTKAQVKTTTTLPPTNVRYVPIVGPIGPIGPDGKAIRGDAGESVTGPPGASIQGEPGASIVGPMGPPGASVKGDKGDTGGQGPGPTDAQIAQAVADYCAAHNECKNDSGAPAPIIPTP